MSMSVRNFEIVLDPQPEGGYCVHVPDLPDVVTEGESREEAISVSLQEVSRVAPLELGSVL